jgi:hypothetical protein
VVTRCNRLTAPSDCDNACQRRARDNLTSEDLPRSVRSAIGSRTLIVVEMSERVANMAFITWEHPPIFPYPERRG